MFLSSQSVRIFLSIPIITSIVTNLPISFGAGFAPLILPSNVTDLISAMSDANLFEQNTTLPDPALFDNNISWPENAPNAPTTNLSSSSTAVSLPSSPSMAPNFACNGKAYGKNLNYASCIEAWNKFPTDSEAITFGERGHGSWGANLPFRILSSNGLCAFDISHQKGVIFDTIAPDNLKANARVLLDICVNGNPNVGGVVSKLGQNGNLVLRVTPYRPTVRCAPFREWNPPAQDCRILLDEMPTDGIRRVFGSKDDPDPSITVKLPTGFRRSRCSVYVDALLPDTGTDTSDWYKMCTYAADVL